MMSQHSNNQPSTSAIFFPSSISSLCNSQVYVSIFWIGKKVYNWTYDKILIEERERVKIGNKLLIKINTKRTRERE